MDRNEIRLEKQKDIFNSFISYVTLLIVSYLKATLKADS